MTVSSEIRAAKTEREVAEAWTKHCLTILELRPVNVKKNAPDISEIMESHRGGIWKPAG